MKILRKETHELPVQLTPDETLDKAQELARVIQETGQEEDRQKNLKDQMKARLSELTARRTRLSLIVARGEEYRDVEIAMTLTDEGMIQEVRLDTEEIIRTRPPKDDERQFMMGAGSVNAPAGA